MKLDIGKIANYLFPGKLGTAVKNLKDYLTIGKYEILTEVYASNGEKLTTALAEFSNYLNYRRAVQAVQVPTEVAEVKHHDERAKHVIQMYLPKQEIDIYKEFRAA